MINKSTIERIKTFFKGEIKDDEKTLEVFSQDASLFRVKPSLVVSPKDYSDLKNLVLFASEETKSGNHLTLTARAAGTDMSGGPLTEGVVVSFTEHFNKIKEIKEKNEGYLGGRFSNVPVTGYATAEPGVYYRDFDKATLVRGGQILPSYPASRELCTVGGMVANNSGGEKTLTYGKTEQYIRRLKMVCADGNEYEFKPLSFEEAMEKRKLQTFEGDIYRKMDELLKSNIEIIKNSKPTVSKNSCGYYLWNIVDKENNIVDLTKMIVGSQGTLGLITEIEFALVKPKKYSHLLVVFLKDLNQLGGTSVHILEHKPESFESYDDQTLKVAFRFLPQLAKQMGGSLLTLGLEFVPEMLAVLEGGLPKLVLMAEFTSDSDAEAFEMAKKAETSLKSFHEKTRVTKTIRDENKYWVIRRESFNMLRKHIHGVRTAPFIDDFVVLPKTLPEFLPRLYKILKPYKNDLTYTIAGHVGDGNFHIIPLMNLANQRSKKVIEELLVKVYTLVHEFNGSITGEHNDGIIRTPFIKMQYGEEVYKIFDQVKKIWDPENIFNPGKKVGGTLEYALNHIVKSS